MITAYGNQPPERITKAFEITYTPLIIVKERIEFLKRFYEWYAQIWGFPSH